MDLRLKHLFATSKTAKFMRCHLAKSLIDNDATRYLVDGKAWRQSDKSHHQFANNIRNVQLGLAANGFNPFSNMSLSYSMWLVVLIIYNLPQWLSMKSKYLMLTLLILSPQSPEKNIDVFLPLLVDELNELW